MLAIILAEAIQDCNGVDGSNAIIDLLSMPSARNNLGPAHLVQMLRDRALLTADRGDDLADHALVMEIQMFQNLKALRVANDLDDIRRPYEKLNG